MSMRNNRFVAILVGAGLLGGQFHCGGGGAGGASNPPLVNTVPTIASQPQSRTVRVPASATFTIVAAGNPAPNFQWNLGGTVIPGATASSYTIPVTTTAMSGGSYTCTVTNPAGSATSEPATLTVHPGASNATVGGTYRGAYFGGTAPAVGTVFTVTYDGNGGFSGSGTLNTGGNISSFAISGTYAVAADGTIASSHLTPRVETSSGFVSADGNTIVGGAFASGEMPYLRSMVRQGQPGASRASLVGPYLFIVYSGNGCTRLQVTFDGAGNFTATYTRNDNGTIVTGSDSGSYSVASDGALSLTPEDGTTLEGSVGVNGDVLVLAGITSGVGPAIAIAIRQGQTRFSAADLDGVFSGIDYSSETDTGYSVAVTFDGAGNYSQVNICNSAGVIAAAPGDSGTCSVTPAGAVANDSGGLGGISADGNTLLMAPFRTGETPAIAVTIK